MTTSEQKNPDDPAAAVSRTNIAERYVAFCDILGFSDRILNDFSQTFDAYRGFCELIADFSFKDVELTIYSDAVLLVGETLAPVLAAAQGLWFFALARNLMLRGAITKGNYWELRKGKHLFVASDALIRAVKLEKTVGVPAIFIADDVEIPIEYWIARLQQDLFITPLLHFRDRNIVNPFNQYWFVSAKARASALMNESPAHKDKYLWFLALHEAVANNEELIPLPVLKRLVDEGVLVKKIGLEG
jgi:hypothetical protein